MKQNKLLRRFTWAYCLMIILPSMLLFAYLYNTMFNQILSEYTVSQTKLMDEAVAAVETKLAYIEKAAESIQFSQILINMVENEHAPDVDIVYTYVSEIQNLFSNVMNYNGSLRELKVYTSNERINELLVEFIPLGQLPATVGNTTKGLFRAQWIPEVDEEELSLSYYCQLLNNRLLRSIGVLQFHCGSEILEPIISWRDDATEYTLYCQGELIYTSVQNDEVSQPDDLLHLTKEEPAHITLDIEKGLLKSQFYFDSLDLQIVIQTHLGAQELIGQFSLGMVFIVLLLFMVLSSLVFYFIIYRPMRNITQLSAHIRSNTGHQLTVYRGNTPDDEIGELIHSYNQLVNGNNVMIERVRKSDLLRKNAQLSALQAQIDPHFFYGTLESIHMIAEANDQNLIAEIALDFSMLMRYSLSKTTVVRLNEEITIVQQYLNIQKKRLGDRFDCDWLITLDTSQILCPKFILQPLVENVIVHSVAKTRKPVHIIIRIEWQNGDVRLSVTDDGPGIDPQRMRRILEMLHNHDENGQMESERNGRGIYNIHRRLQLYYGTEYKLSVESEPFHETTFTITMKPTLDESLNKGGEWTS